MLAALPVRFAASICISLLPFSPGAGMEYRRIRLRNRTAEAVLIDLFPFGILL